MCGICGWYSRAQDASIEAIEGMSAALSHRGPDGEGSWVGSDGRIAFAHRRLAILDPLPRSDQPMSDRDGRALVFNGEIYNFRELRRELESEGCSFRTSGDTEVLFAALKSWGTAAVEALDGQFAFAFWEPDQQRLILARDRLGIKSLFWAPVKDGLIFASELPSLLTHPSLRKSLNQSALARWLQLGYVAGEETLINNVFSLEPGSLLEARADGNKIRRWYDPLAVLERPQRIRTRDEAAEELESLIRASVRRRLVADVPLGCFLSGGIDSSVIAAAAVKEGAAPETLTLRFEGGEDESQSAARMASALGLENRIGVCSWNDLDQRMGAWARKSGDPLADPSFLPSSMVAEFGARSWKVALSGDGGDELLSGYPRLRIMPRIETLLRIPQALRRLPPGLLPTRRWATKLRAAMKTSDPFNAYQTLQGVWSAQEVATLLHLDDVPPAWPADMTDRFRHLSSLRRWRALDLLSFLPGRMLAKVDRSSMATSLECRVPLLDHRIVELLISLPEKMCRNKALFRRVLRAWELPGPPLGKKGFEIPLATWLRGPLQKRINNEFLGGELARRGWNQKLILDRWDRHLSAREDHAEKILSLAVLLSWLREFRL